jgi:hypothetical protein
MLISSDGGPIHFYTHAPGGHIVKLDLDVHDAGELHQALEAHMENVAAPEPITPEERDRLLRKGQRDRLAAAPHGWDEVRRRNLEALRENVDLSRPRLVKDGGEEFTGPRVIIPAEELKDHVALREATREVAEIWKDMDPGMAPTADPRQIVRSWAPDLAAAIDRLAELNA